jgi:hypothetical protein
MRISPDMDLAQLRDLMGEASLLDAAALRDVLIRRRVRDTAHLAGIEWSDAIAEAHRRLPAHLRPETA